MRMRTFHSAGFSDDFQISAIFTPQNKQLQRCLYHLKVNILPTILFLMCSSLITLYISDQVYRAKLRTAASEQTAAGHPASDRE